MNENTQKMIEFLNEHNVLALSDCCGSCPCGALYIKGLHVSFHCWRPSCNECKYSGVHVWADEDWEYDLKVLGDIIVKQLENSWSNTEWNLSFSPR